MKKITPALAFASLPSSLRRRRLAKDTTPEEVRKEAREIFQKVIAFRTSEGLGQVPAMAQYLAERFRAADFPEEDIHILPVGETASLVVRYRGNGRGGKPILLLAHMDVVTAKPEEWQRDPFTLIEENGYFFGRGTLDNKQGVTALTTTFLRLKREGFVPTRDLIIAFSGDEETGMLTTTDLANKNRALIDAEYALNSDDGGGQLDEKTGKPQYLSFVGAEKISATYELTVRNPGGHSSAPRADNAIYELADALKALQAYRFPVKSNDWTLGSFKATGPVTAGSARRGDDALRCESSGRSGRRNDREGADRSRQDAHDVRRDDAPRRSRLERLAADGDCDGELPHLPRHECRRGQGEAAGTRRQERASALPGQYASGGRIAAA